MVTSFTNVSTTPNFNHAGFVVNITGGTLGASSTAMSPLFPNETSYPDILPSNITFIASTAFSETLFLASCILTRSSVGSNVTCRGPSCGVSQIRRSKFNRRPPGYIPFSVGSNAWLLSIQWPELDKYSATTTEYFLRDPTLQDLITPGNVGGVDLVGLPADTFSQRFSLLLNTYWQCSLAPWYQTGHKHRYFR